MKKLKGIIFDFNGTLILDDEKHLAAWQKHAAELGASFTEDEYYNNMHGTTNDHIYEVLFKKPMPSELAGKFGQQKEIYYREAFKADPPPFAKGARELLDFLKENDIPRAIATSSEISNVNFFKEIYNLEYWFGDNIIYDDGTVRGKPFPDLYLKAGDKLSIPMEQLATVEDSRSGACACRRSGSGLVMGICPRGAEKFVGAEYTDITITDFTDIDYKNMF